MLDFIECCTYIGSSDDSLWGFISDGTGRMALPKLPNLFNINI